MHRRQLINTALLLGLLSALPERTLLATTQTRHRVRPGESGWPTDHQWDALRGQLIGELIQPQPILAACVSDRGSAACADVLKHLNNPYYIGDQAAGTEVSGWYKAWSPQASAYAVVAKSESDVVTAVDFAREHSLRVVVKGGGHSYQGTSNAPDSLLIWTRQLRGISLHDAFTASGCTAIQPPCPAVTIQAGAMWMDVYDAVTTQAGRYVQGGGCATVGVAGLVQSGGFGSFSKGFGTASGSLLEAHVVTSDGKLRVVSACQDPDLFWALKGGGGGTFGVVTQVTLRTHDLPEFFGYAEGTIQASSDQSFRQLLQYVVEFYAGQLFNAHWGEQIYIGKENVLKFSMVSQGLDDDAVTAIWKPLMDWVAASPSSYKVVEDFSLGAFPARHWWDVQRRLSSGSKSVVFDDRGSAPTHGWWHGDQAQVGAFLHASDSIWLPDSLLAASEQPRLVDALFDASRQFGVQLHMNKGLAGAPSVAIDRARDTAMNPAVLTSFALAIVAAGERSRFPGLRQDTPDDRMAEQNAAAIDRAMGALRTVAPFAGSYVSESNYFNSAWQESFWGPHAARLQQVKAKFDPAGLFFVHHGIGSEHWSADGFTRKD